MVTLQTIFVFVVVVFVVWLFYGYFLDYLFWLIFLLLDGSSHEGQRRNLKDREIITGEYFNCFDFIWKVLLSDRNFATKSASEDSNTVSV